MKYRSKLLTNSHSNLTVVSKCRENLQCGKRKINKNALSSRLQNTVENQPHMRLRLRNLCKVQDIWGIVYIRRLPWKIVLISLLDGVSGKWNQHSLDFLWFWVQMCKLLAFSDWNHHSINFELTIYNFWPRFPNCCDCTWQQRHLLKFKTNTK